MGERVCLVGPTASGKSELAAELARARSGVELLSVDSIAVYRGLDIGTAKPSKAERAELSWHLIDLVEASDEFSVAEFQVAAEAAVARIEARGHDVLAVGGTGLYQRALVDGLELAGRYPKIAAELEETADEPGGLEQLFERLSRLDPLGASRVEPQNRRRIVRALEVSLGTGRAFSSFGAGLSTYPPSSYRLVGIEISRSELDERIAERVDAHLAAGFVAEVKSLLEAPRPLSRTAAQALGYKELIAHSNGELSLEEAREEIVSRTRRLARRQQSWFRRDPRVIWLDRPGEQLEQLLELFGTEPSRPVHVTE